MLKNADFIFMNELKKSNYYNKIWQAYAGLLPVKTVGVMGDSRSYEYICILRAVISEDGMTADFFTLIIIFYKKYQTKLLIQSKGLTESSMTLHQNHPAQLN